MIDEVQIRNCTIAFRCIKTWNELRDIGDSTRRFCDECRREVFYCHTNAELAEAIRMNRCVAITLIANGKTEFIMGDLVA